MLTFSSSLGEIKQLRGEPLSRQSKVPALQKRDSPCWDETFEIYEDFIKLSESRQNGTEFHPRFRTLTKSFKCFE